MRWTLPLLLLAAVPPATADLFTVGPGGTHSSVQLAVITALARGGSHEIRIAQGRWRGEVRIAGVPGDALRISGGWNPSFSVQTGDAASTRIDSLGVAPVLDVDLEEASVTLSRLTITGARVPSVGPSEGFSGGGVRARLRDGARLELIDTVVRDNHLVHGGSITAAGMEVSSLSSTLTVRNSTIEDNSVTATNPNAVAGAAAALVATGSSGSQAARTVFAGNRIRRNRSTSPGAGFAPSLMYLGVSGNATAELTENSVADNEAVEGAAATTAGTVLFVSGFGGAPFEGRAVARRNNFQDNRGPGADAPQLALQLRGGQVELTDGLFVRGDGGGVRVDAATGTAGGASTAFLTNLTVTAHPGFGLERVPGDGRVFLSNTVLFGNGSDLVGTVDPLANLVGVDPRFIDPARDYRLRLDSPGIDTGDDGAPGGLGPLDILGGPRVLGPSVDVGAFEAAGASGGDGTCRALWPIVDRFTPACVCATDRGLRNHRCAFFGPEIFAVLNTRLPGPGGRPVQAEWTLHPWTPVVGRYQMDAALLLNGQWQKQPWLGPTEPRLREGDLVIEPFLLEVPTGEPTWLRTRLRYRPRGQKPVVAEFEVLLPAAERK